MKKSLLVLLPLLLLQACSEKVQLTFREELKVSQECDSCPRVELNYHKATGNLPVARVINQAVEEEIIAQLHFREDLQVDDLAGAIRSFANAPEDLPYDEATPWMARIRTEVTHENDEVVTLALDIYTYTGGAHGLQQTRYLNFDKKTAEELDSWELFRDNRLFRAYAEKAFREMQQIPADRPINSTGFMFRNNRFHLPDNIGYTDRGLTLHYNPYEVASYADGPVVVTLPFSSIKKYLSRS